ncbi:MAG: gliding motility lipoprotein GldH [Prevotellaceae bacterium]|jgi:gliding motility-associated lipoprotein GldH|nr:gliding motility lipoprotein GldH [Prevotellaceae bacterium]
MTRPNKKTFVLATILLSLFVVSCTSNIVYQENITLKDAWHQDSLATFDVNMTDTVGAYNIFIDLRNDNRYPYQNLWLFVSSVSPDSIARTDTLETVLAGNDGQWIGRGFGSNYDLALFYMQDIQFPETGTYRFSIGQGMRDEQLEGITGVGLRIEKAD